LIYLFLFLDILIKGYGSVVADSDGSFFAVCENNKKIEVSFGDLNAKACKIESKNKNNIFFSEGIDGLFQERYFFSAPLARATNSNLVMEKGLSVSSDTLNFSTKGIASFDKTGVITLEGPDTKISYSGIRMHAQKLIIENENIFLYGDSFFENDLFSFSSEGPVYYWNYEEKDVLSAKNFDSFEYFFNEKEVLNIHGKDFLMYFYEADQSLLRVAEFSLTFNDYSFFSENVSIQKFEDFLHIRSMEGEVEIKNEKNSIYAKEIILFDDFSWKAINGVRVVF